MLLLMMTWWGMWPIPLAAAQIMRGIFLILNHICFPLVPTVMSLHADFSNSLLAHLSQRYLDL